MEGMIEPKRITVDGLEFNLNPLPALKALKLDKKIIALILPALSGAKGVDLDAEIDLSVMMTAISESLDRLSDDDTEKLFVDLLYGVQYLPAGGAVEDITGETINKVFQGKLMTLYKLAMEVMKYNKFTPFTLAGNGGLSNIIRGSIAPVPAETKSSRLSDRLGNLPTN
jgi:hypothetical protein